MTRDEAKQLLPIIQAWSEGKEIQRMCFAEDKWKDAHLETDFLCVPSAYRIKPEPVECWAVVTEHGYVAESYLSKECADTHVMQAGGRVIRMREVL